MKSTAILAALLLLSSVNQPVLALYIDPAVAQDIRSAKFAGSRSAKYINPEARSSYHVSFQYAPSLRIHEAKSNGAHEYDLERPLAKRARIGKFMAKFSTAGAKKAVKFSKHHPKVAAMLVTGIAAKTAYELLHHDDDHHDHHMKTVIYVNDPSRLPVSRRGVHKAIKPERDEDDDDDGEMHLAKREPGGPVDRFMGRTIKKGALGTSNFAKKNPYTAAAVGGTLLTMGAVKLYNLVKSDDADTQIIRLVKRGSKEEDDTALGKRSPPQKLSITDRAKAFVKTKKGKVIVGGMGVKAALTVGFLYYMRQRNAKPAQVPAGTSLLYGKQAPFHQAPIHQGSNVNQAIMSASKGEDV